ncbi:hypothetical protein [Streptomyces sp. NPDC017448]
MIGYCSSALNSLISLVAAAGVLTVLHSLLLFLMKGAGEAR